MVQQAPSPAARETDDPFGWTGHTLEGRYAIEELVGEGGFAVVYRGHHKGLDDAIAIKCLKIPRKLAGEERERFLQSFLDEGKLLHRLSRANANIVQALDVGATTSPNGTWTPYLVLEWLEGQTLEEDLRARVRAGVPPRSLGEAIALLEPAASALATAHAQGIAHRDIKPANLFLCTVAGKLGIKVVDFGIAKVIGESTDLQRAHEATGMSLHAFTPRYGAPEQFDRRFGATGPWTDVFAMALIVVEIVAGRSPLQGDSAQLFVAASNVHHRPTLRAFETSARQATDAVEDVLLRALAVDPKERYASCGEFWTALTAALPAPAPAPAPDSSLGGERPTDGSGRGSGSGENTIPDARRVDPLAATVPSERVPMIDARRLEPPRSISAAIAALDEPPPRASSSRAWLGGGIAAVAVLGGAWFLTGPRDDARTVSSVSSASAPPSSSSRVEAPAPPPREVPKEEPAAPAPAPVQCAAGLIAHVEPTVGYALCIPETFRDVAAVDGVFRRGDLELTVRGGYLAPPEVTLDALFERAAKDDPDGTGRSILPGKTEKTADSYVLAGTARGKRFFERTVTTTDRFATFQVVYSDAERKAIEPKLERMIPTFIVTAAKTAR